MKKILLMLAVMAATALLPARAQDVALLQERVKQLTGKVENLEETNLTLRRQIEELVREVASLRDQQRTQPAGTPASNDDLRELAKKVQEIERKRAADRDYLENEFDRLAKLIKSSPASSPPPTRGSSSSADLPKDAVEHTIASGDTLLAIALAYSKETGRKITTDLIMKANPGLDPRKLQPGQKILVPLP